MRRSELQPVQKDHRGLLKESLRDHVSAFGRQILDHVEFSDIDLDDPENGYHLDMVRGLIEHDGKQKSLLETIILKEKIHDAVERIIVESFEMRDVSLKIGSKRNVDRVVLVFDNGKIATMTVSLDKEPAKSESQSPSFQEFQTLQPIQREKAWCVQNVYGYKGLKGVQGTRGMICKEYLHGDMLALFTGDLQRAISVYGEEHMRAIARATGRAVANAYTEFGGIPSDSNAFNFIVKQGEAGMPSVRYCDVEAIRTDKDGIAHELRLIKKDFGQFASDFMNSLQENYKGDLNIAV